MAEHGYRMVRYADDFVILTRSREEADAALAGLFALHTAWHTARQSLDEETTDWRAVCGKTARTVVCPVKAGVFSRR